MIPRKLLGPFRLQISHLWKEEGKCPKDSNTAATAFSINLAPCKYPLCVGYWYGRSGLCFISTCYNSEETRSSPWRSILSLNAQELESDTLLLTVHPSSFSESDEKPEGCCQGRTSVRGSLWWGWVTEMVDSRLHPGHPWTRKMWCPWVSLGSWGWEEARLVKVSSPALWLTGNKERSFHDNTAGRRWGLLCNREGILD